MRMKNEIPQTLEDNIENKYLRNLFELTIYYNNST